MRHKKEDLSVTEPSSGTLFFTCPQFGTMQGLRSHPFALPPAPAGDPLWAFPVFTKRKILLFTHRFIVSPANEASLL
jgi:hypothetical protein